MNHTESNETPSRVAARMMNRLAVVGPDLDLPLCMALTAGDKVLMEASGARFWSAQEKPLVAEFPWEVVSNGMKHDVPTRRPTGKIVLRHPKVKQPFVLDGDDLFDNGPNQPAVFFATHPAAEDGIHYVILQMVAFYTTREIASRLFPVDRYVGPDEFDATLEGHRARVGLFNRFSKVLSGMDDGWGYKQVQRMALRANVRVELIRAIGRGDLEDFLKCSVEEVMAIRRECHWLPMLLKQANLISHDAKATHEYRKQGGDANAAVE